MGNVAYVASRPGGAGAIVYDGEEGTGYEPIPGEAQ